MSNKPVWSVACTLGGEAVVDLSYGRAPNVTSHLASRTELRAPRRPGVAADVGRVPRSEILQHDMQELS